jgi:hypothetical protein
MMMKWAGHVAHMGEMNNRYKIYVGKLEEKTSLLRSRCRWDNNIIEEFKDLGWKSAFI